MIRKVSLNGNSKSNEFENDNYKCVYTTRHDVVGRISIFKNKGHSPMPYMVLYGNTTVFFQTYDDARNYIRERFENNKY